MNRQLSFVGTMLISALFASASLAASLTITGADGTVIATLDREAIEATGLRSISTATPWTDGISQFEGASLERVLERAGVAGRAVTALAFDDYAVTLTPEAISLHAPIIATRLNGQFMTISDKGPFWIIFDFDDKPAEVAAELRALAVWHLIEFEVE